MAAGDGQKEIYKLKDVWKVSFVPEEMRLMLYEAANTGSMGSFDRNEAIAEAINLSRLMFPRLFRPKEDF